MSYTKQYIGLIEGNKQKSKPITTEGPLLSRLRTKLHVHPDDFPEVLSKACRTIDRLPDPEGPPSEVIGLMLGRIQAGKTNAMITTAALAVDNGYKVVVVLTSDNTWLYTQTLGRFKQALPGLTCVGMDEWSEKRTVIQSVLSHGAVLFVTTKNRTRLEALNKVLASIGAADYPALIFDDEADQASLDTNASKRNQAPSPINARISQTRSLFRISAFVEVTATPQALLLLDRASDFRPQFIVVLEPGTNYIGGDVYFAQDSPYLVPVQLDELAALKSKDDLGSLPSGLRQALATFLIGASARLVHAHDSAYSCLIHVSLKRTDHTKLQKLVHGYVNLLIKTAASGYRSALGATLLGELREAYDHLSTTAPGLPPLDDVIRVLIEFGAGTDVQVLNSGNEQKQPRYDHPFNILIGGTKLGRGVTIRGLLVTYYGRESRKPQMDTVQQHARMYGYRRYDLPISRIFLPDLLAAYFRDINTSENELREWLATLPDATIHPLVIPTGMKATRSNVLNPANVACYVPGQAYTPGTAAFVGYTDHDLTTRIDSRLGIPKRGEHFAHNVTVDEVIELLSLIHTPPGGAGRWEDKRIQAALRVLKEHFENQATIVSFAGRNLRPREKPNVADSDDLDTAPTDRPALFLFRQNGDRSLGWSGVPFWIPVVRFPHGKYPIGFNFT